mgnify:FL=1
MVLCTEEEDFVPFKMQLEQCLDILYKHGMLRLAEQQNYNSLEEIMGKKWKDFDWDLFYSEQSPNSAYFIVYAHKAFFSHFMIGFLKNWTTRPMSAIIILIPFHLLMNILLQFLKIR